MWLALSKKDKEWDWYVKHTLEINKHRDENAYNWLNYNHKCRKDDIEKIVNLKIDNGTRKKYYVTGIIFNGGDSEWSGLWYGNRGFPIILSNVIEHLNEVSTDMSLVDSIKKMMRKDSRLIEYFPKLDKIDLDVHLQTGKKLDTMEHTGELEFKYLDFEKKLLYTAPTFNPNNDLVLKYS